MRKLLNQPWFVALLAMSAIVLCTLSLRGPSGAGRTGGRGTAAVVAPEPSLAEGADADGTISSDLEKTPRSIAAVLAALQFPANIPDPFARRGATMVAGDPEAPSLPTLPDDAESIRLTAVWQQGLTRLALVNNRILHAGEQLGRLTVDEISIDGIWVSHWRGRDFVAFGGAFTLLTPAGAMPAPAVALHEN